jgi:hypothetical protein
MEISRPPDSITNVWAMATNPSSETDKPMLRMFNGLKNFWASCEPMTSTRMSNVMSRPRF